MDFLKTLNCFLPEPALSLSLSLVLFFSTAFNITAILVTHKKNLYTKTWKPVQTGQEPVITSIYLTTGIFISKLV